MTRDLELDAQTVDVGAEVGYTLHLGHNPGLTICPLVAYVINFGPYDLLLYDLDQERRSTEIGLGAGTVLRLREGGLRFVPAMHVRRVALTLRSRARLWEEPDITQAYSATHWIVGGAVGIILTERLTIRPGFSILGGFPAEGSPGYHAVPFGREEWEKSLNITIAIAMWRRSESSAVQRRRSHTPDTVQHGRGNAMSAQSRFGRSAGAVAEPRNEADLAPREKDPSPAP